MGFCCHVWGQSPSTSVLDTTQRKAVYMVNEHILFYIYDPLPVHYIRCFIFSLLQFPQPPHTPQNLQTVPHLHYFAPAIIEQFRFLPWQLCQTIQSKTNTSWTFGLFSTTTYHPHNFPYLTTILPASGDRIDINWIWICHLIYIFPENHHYVYFFAFAFSLRNNKRK